VPVPCDPTLYEGAAAHYRYGRPPYSPQLEAVLAEELELDGSGRLLDVGCGPGILTVRIAPLFEEAVGLDPDPAMLAEARRSAGERGVANVRWVEATAEELPGAEPGPFRLVSFGQSFHWMDELPPCRRGCVRPARTGRRDGSDRARCRGAAGAAETRGRRRFRTPRSAGWWRSTSDRRAAPAPA
jgi:SAM-dependent methyltransferase